MKSASDEFCLIVFKSIVLSDAIHQWQWYSFRWKPWQYLLLLAQFFIDSSHPTISFLPYVSCISLPYTFFVLLLPPCFIIIWLQSVMCVCFSFKSPVRMHSARENFEGTLEHFIVNDALLKQREEHFVMNVFLLSLWNFIYIKKKTVNCTRNV